MDFNESRMEEATLKLHTHGLIFSRLSIASVDDKQHLSEVVFSALVGFSLLEQYPTFGGGKKKIQAYPESQKSQRAWRTTESGFFASKSE